MCEKGDWRSFKTMRRRSLSKLPRRSVSAQFQNLKTGVICYPVRNVQALPRTRYPLGDYGSVWESASVKVLNLKCLLAGIPLIFHLLQFSDIVSIHLKAHPNTRRVMDLSVDGVSKDKSSLVPVDVFSVRFPNCRRIYIMCIVRIDKYQKYDINEFLKECIDQIK